MRLLLTFFLLLWLAPARDSAVSWLGPTTYEMGDLIHKEAATHEFRFRNISSDTLYIDNVRPSCGCTFSDWNKAPIPPDSTGSIRVEYDARDIGYFKKKLKVYFSNQRRAEVLWLEGWVVDID